MKNDELKCSQCGFISKKGQNFCGECGQKLEKVCPDCNSANPPDYNFCGQCGKDLRILGALLLDRTGLIVKIDPAASSILQLEADKLLGKPLAIFVGVTDRAHFFTCWNTALNSFERQELEVDLQPAQDRIITTRLIIKPPETSTKGVDSIQLEIEDRTNDQVTLQQNKQRDKLLKTIESLTGIFHPGTRETRQKTIIGVLEKIGLASQSQHAFVSRIDPLSRLVFTEFLWQATPGPNASSAATLPLESLQPVLENLQKGLAYITDDFNSLALSEHHLWNRWHPGISSPGSIACELIYRDHHPVGIIGLIRDEKGTWPQDAIMLLNLSARLLSETLPKHLPGNIVGPREELTALENGADYSEDLSVLEEVEIVDNQYEPLDIIDIIENGFTVEPLESGNPDEAHRVFATDDGVYVLQCPRCGQRESIPVDHFDHDGWILQVSCHCGCSFQIVREMRKAFRKEVQLFGSFSPGFDELNKIETTGKWNSMEVTNISKIGLNFKTPVTKLLTIGDHVQLKFNLDNSTNSLINKKAMIKSVRKNQVGCEFQNGNKSDTTLGFYFI